MNRRRSLLLVIILACTLLLSARPPTASADGSRTFADSALAVVKKGGNVRLVACTVTTEFRCEGDACALAVRQAYRLSNASRSQGATLQLGIPTPPTQVQAASPSLTDAEGNPVAPVEGTADYPIAWDVSLGPGAMRNLTLETHHALGTGHLVHWLWNGAHLSGWGSIDGVLIEVKLPQLVTDDVVLHAEPIVHRFDGRTLIWEYELLQNPVQHELLLYAPHTSSALKSLQTGEAYRELAGLYEAIDAEARASNLPVPDHYSEIVGALQAARDRDPADIAAWLDLAAIYRGRADALPELRLSYLLLAAQELEHAAEQHPHDAQIAEALIHVYQDVASTAHDQGDLAAATEYLRKAQEASSASPPEVMEALAELRLLLALRLAEQGSATEALGQVEGLLSPPVEQTLLHYAPPLLSAHTTVELAPGMRRATYALRLYPPTAQNTLSQIEGIRETLRALDHIHTDLQTSPDAAELTLEVSWDSIDALQQTAQGLVQAIPAEGSLLRALLATPWQSDLQSFGVEASRWREQYVYQEYVDLAPLQATWEEAYQYAQWRLAELESGDPSDERAALEKQFALVVLREQDRLWKHLPLGSYWSYRASYSREQAAQPNLRAMIAWGQSRHLEDLQTAYNWPLIQRIALVVAGALGATLLLLLLRRP